MRRILAALILALPAALPVGRADEVGDRDVRRLDAAGCYAQLDRMGVRYARPATEGVEIPVRLRGRIGGIAIEFVGRRRSNEVMDCRVALAIARFAVPLREAGLTRIRHLSAYRGGARHRRTGRPSGHSTGLAVDLRYFDFGADSGSEDEDVFDVLEHWQPRVRGAEPCTLVDGEPERSRLLRSAMCDAVERGLFQVVVTPHHDDHHANHLHVEVVPSVGWTWVR